MIDVDYNNSFYTPHIESDENQSKKLIIRYSMKLMKLLHFYIYEIGAKYNTEKRITRMPVHKEVVKDLKEDCNYCLITWNQSYEDKNIAKAEILKEENLLLVKFAIKEQWKYVGGINEIAQTDHEIQSETLIPAHSCFYFKSIKKQKIKLLFWRKITNLSSH